MPALPPRLAGLRDATAAVESTRPFPAHPRSITRNPFMKCNLKSMATLAAALLAVLAVAYVAFPAAQAAVLASAPILLALICPISMIIMMLTMRGHGASTHVAPQVAPQAAAQPLRQSPDAAQEA
ncbi:MAG: DUF2933 domain-containing protein [Rubrivivax sp.]